MNFLEQVMIPTDPSHEQGLKDLKDLKDLKERLQKALQ